MRHSRRRYAALVLAAAAFLSISACSNGLDPADPAAIAMRAADDPTAIARLAEDAPAPQAAILEDGQVSDAEYEQAVTADRDCVSVAGYEPSELRWNDGQVGFEVSANYEGEADPEAADEAFLAAVEQCWKEHSKLVGTVWSARK
ncbi:hypothetical protein MO973_30590 [Paenibacillus sp. TRM 82003]|uniref:hypothetical protein n=1 Tax=Kineococcus sp. TRM81007 TaxID=2925831 RepID=UPI001F58E0B9|nr:hypothetical protein [Kineococcus sp. TRM81007]MCI2238577.1 hypothetical protein [Kineococcus sp. TRM81007]MCI3924570.1 hypothetical protein [Paenibacillus sp. TRM 82003]